MEMEENKIVTIPKEHLAELPAEEFHGKIVLVDSLEDAEAAAHILAQETLIGFDTETKPSFKRGQSHQVALLQLSSHSTSFLFRLNHIGLPDCVKAILEDPDITKVGLSIRDDFHNLHKIYSLNPAGFIDLQNYVKQYHIIDNSLARIYAILFNHRISKGQRLTNWEAEELSSHQQAYAALDALACIRIYDYLNQGKFNPEASPYFKILPPEEEAE